MLLLVALLVTAVPVMVISANDGEGAGDAPVFEDVTTLYVGAKNGLDPSVKDGQLTGLFTAFAGETDVYDLRNGKWLNKASVVENTSFATLRNTKTSFLAWGPAEKGGLRAGIDSAQELYDAGYKGEGIDFPVSLLTDSFTVEATAVTHAFDFRTISSVSQLYCNSPTTVYKDTFRVGLMTGFFSANNSRDNKAAALFRTDLCAHFSCQSTWNYGFAAAIGVKGVGATNSEPAATYAPGGATFAMTRLYDATAATYTYGLAFSNGDNTVCYGRLGHAGGMVYGKGDHDAAIAAFDDSQTYNNTLFTMFNRMPADVYAVRVYNYVLNGAEKQYNHLIDLFGFYQIAVPADVTVENLQSIAADFYGKTFVYDNDPNKGSGDYDVNKAALEAALAKIIPDPTEPAEKTVYDELYIDAGLVGLFTAFAGDDTVAAGLADGRWYNKVGLAYATLRDTSDELSWAAGTTNGGLTTGIATAAQFDDAGKKSIGMDFPVGLLEDNFTVEATAVAWAFARGPKAHYLNEMTKDTFRFDVLTGLYSPVYDASVRMLLIWRTDTCTLSACVSGRSFGFSQAAGIGDGSGTAVQGQAPAKYAPGGTTFYVSRAYDGENYTYSTAFSNGANAAVCTSSADGGKSTYTKAEHDAAVAGFDASLADNNTRFTMFNRMPADVYAVRVYNRALNATEKQYNHLIDLLAFYKVEIPVGITAEMLALTAADVFDMDFVYNETAGIGSGTRSGNKAELEAIWDSFPTEPAEKTAYDELYVEEGLVGLFTAFGSDTASYNLEKGRWYNKAGLDYATLRNTTDFLAWSATANGGLSAGIDDIVKLKNAGKNGVGIDFSNSLLASDSFTVESAAVYYGIDFNATDPEGNPLVSSISDIYVNNINGLADYKDNFRVGLMSGFLSANKDRGTKMSALFRTDKCDHYSCNSSWNWGFAAAVGIVNGDATNYAPGGATFAMTRVYDETAESYTYGVSFNHGDYSTVCTASQPKVEPKVHNGGMSYTAAEHAAALESTAKLFSMFNRTPADVYAVRVYDRTLKASEQMQNHFVDMLSYYQVVLPKGLDSFAPLAALAEEHVEDTLYHIDQPGYNETKTALQNSVDALARVIFNEGELYLDSEWSIENGTYRLPATVDGRTVVAFWNVSEDKYQYPGDLVTVDGAVTLDTLLTADAAITTDDEVVVRVYEDEGVSKLGIRFSATVNMTSILETLAMMDLDESSIKNYGILITPKAYVEAAGAFTVPALDAWAAAQGSTAGAYVPISSTDWYNKDDPAAYVVAGTLGDFSAETLAKNPEFAAIAFIEVDTDDEDTISDFIIYGEYDESLCVSVKEVAELALAQEQAAATPDTAKIDALNELIGSFATAE